MKKILIAGTALAAMMATAAPSYAAKCSRVAAEGVAVTKILATANATQGLSEAIAAKGLKAKGKSTMSCKYDFVVSTCKAMQRACK